MAISTIFQDTTLSVGDVVKVNYKIKEKDGKDRIQAFDGTILSISGQKTEQKLLVLKKASDNVQVERIFPLNSPWIDSIKKIRSPKRTVRRAKLYNLRDPKARTL
jgi:large subunit ribosomal protein L19